MGVVSMHTMCVLIINNEVKIMSHVGHGCRISIYGVPGCGFRCFIHTEIFQFSKSIFSGLYLIMYSTTTWEPHLMLETEVGLVILLIFKPWKKSNARFICRVSGRHENVSSSTKSEAHFVNDLI